MSNAKPSMTSNPAKVTTTVTSSPTITGGYVPEPPPEKRIAIVGFTASKDLVPWGQDGWEIWICNNLWKFCPDQWHRLYDLHDLETIKADKEHEAFLTGAPQKHFKGGEVKLGDRVVACWKPQAEWPTAKGYPRDVITDLFGRYFSNSISWMIAHALLEMKEAAKVFADAKLAEMATVTTDTDFFGVIAPGLHKALEGEYLARCELHVYGVDMAQGTEYAAQRPSCEFFLGRAAGMGIKMYVPPTSDLLKVSAMYGAEDDSAFFLRCSERLKELDERGAAVQQNLRTAELQLAQIQGARETTAYFKGVWSNPRANRDGSAKDADQTAIEA